MFTFTLRISMPILTPQSDSLNHNSSSISLRNVMCVSYNFVFYF